MRKDIRIVLLGDEKVGKSSIIAAIVRDCFVEQVPALIPEVTIPQVVTTEKITTHIIDTSTRLEHKFHLEDELKKASVICAVFDITEKLSYQRIATFWIPYLRQLGVSVPIIVVGNKIDALEGEVETRYFDNIVEELMRSFKEIVCGCECSAKTVTNIATLFYLAQRMVIYPINPLYDCQDHRLKPKCIDAFRRIFKLCDKDRDGLLNDTEINYFQLKCFSHSLDAASLDALKDITRQHLPSGLSVPSNFFNEEGFLFLQMLCVQKGKQESPWIALRKFGYGEDLLLKKDFLCPFIEVPSDASCELSPKGYQFFTELFRACDKDKDGALSPRELDELFATSPGHPWQDTDFPNTTLTNANGFVTLQGFLAQWSMTTLLEYRKTLKYLGYLGYDDDLKSAVQITQSRRVNRQKNRVLRNVFLCYVFGANGSGKTSLLRSFLHKPWKSGVTVDMKEPYSVVNSVEIRGSEKYLVLVEGTALLEQELQSNPQKLDACDAICFFYDASDPNSFSYVAKLRDSKRFDATPCIFVAAKSDLDAVSQRYEMQPIEYCKRLLLLPPVSISSKQQQLADIFHLLISLSLDPSRAIPMRKNRSKRYSAHRPILFLAASFAGLSLGIYSYYRFIRRPSPLPTLASSSLSSASHYGVS